MKIKYTWQTVHGDADHYDNQELILTNENEIAFFDYLTTQIEFEPRMMKGFLPTEEQLPILVSLMRNMSSQEDNWLTPTFEEFKNNLENYDGNNLQKKYKEAVLYDLTEIVCDWNYNVSDVTCDHMHYAKIQNFKREDITNIISSDTLLQFIIDKYKLNKNELEQEYLKGIDKKSNRNPKFVKVSMQMPLNIGKPNRNGIIMSQEAYNNLINSNMENLPIIYEEDKDTVIGVGNGTVIDNDIIINGYLWKCEPEFMINKGRKSGDTLIIDEAILSCISLNHRKES